jgi:hypothetical protein
MEDTIPAVEREIREDQEGGRDESGEEDDRQKLQQERRRRLRDYHIRALAHEDPCQAMLGSVNAELMLVTMRVDQAINNSLAVGSATIEGVMQCSQAIDMLLKLTRQIDRFAQLELRPRDKAQKDVKCAPGDCV